MTFSTHKALQPLSIFTLLLLIFSGCVKDTCKQSYTYKIYKPVYMSYETLRSSVKTLPASDLKNVGKIYYKAPYIFINETDKGIHVIDNTNPSSPQNIAFINIPGNVDLAVKDNYLYADSYIDLVTIDISNPSAATEVTRAQNVFPDRIYTNGWAPDISKGVVINWIEADTTVEQNCSQPFRGLIYEDVFTAGVSATSASGGTATTGNFVTPGNGLAGSMARFTIYENFLYCLDNYSMKLFDINNASHPSQGTTVQMPWNIETIFPYEHYLFIGATSGVYIYNNTNPSSPEYMSVFSHVTQCDPVVVQGNYAYATLRNGNTCQGYTNELDVIDISNLYSPSLKATVGMNHPFGLGIDGKSLFICDDNAGLKLYDANDPLNVQLQQTVTAGETRDVIAVNNLLLLVTTNGLYEFDYSSGTMQQLSYLAIGK